MTSDWMDDAACAGTGAWWDALTVAEQQAECADCPVARECLAWAESFDAADTVFGGKRFPAHSRLRLTDPRWDADDDRRLLAAGPEVAASLTGRSISACKTRFYALRKAAA